VAGGRAVLYCLVLSVTSGKVHGLRRNGACQCPTESTWEQAVKNFTESHRILPPASRQRQGLHYQWTHKKHQEKETKLIFEYQSIHWQAAAHSTKLKIRAW